MNEEKKEYWRWPEYNWHDENGDWRGKRVTAGVDVGSVSSQAVILVDGKMVACANMRTGHNSPESARRVISWAMEGTRMKLEDIHFVVGTGYGRVKVPFANRAITEIACHARGAIDLYGDKVRTVLDMGGQDLKVIRCDQRGKVSNFIMNEKCAAGTGRGMEVIADILGVPIVEAGQRSLQIDKEPPPVSTVCVLFAKTEALGLLREGWSTEKVLAAYCRAMAERVFTLTQTIGVERELAITGGIAKNPGIVKRLERMLGFEPLKTEKDSQLAGALGAALFARVLYEKQKAQEK
jgi:bzd-type benzoyl-CoA reductase Q subunit